MAIINYTDQLKYAGRGYLDAKMMPVKHVNDLKNISLTQRFEGLTITVLNDGAPQDYWLIGGITNDKWIPKTGQSNFTDLKLALEDGFLTLLNGETQLGDKINLNEFFPDTPSSPDGPTDSNDLYIKSVDYSTTDNNNNTGIFMCFTYSDNTKKYLDMSAFLSNTYKAGDGIIISGDTISIDSAINGKIEKLITDVTNLQQEVNDAQSLLTTVNTDINAIKNDYLTSTDKQAISSEIASAKTDIQGITTKIQELKGSDSGNTKSIRTIASEEVAKIISDADTDYDTLKEIADWIKQHPEDVTELNRLIAENTNNINNLGSLLNTLSNKQTNDTQALNDLINTEINERKEAIKTLDERISNLDIGGDGEGGTINEGIIQNMIATEVNKLKGNVSEDYDTLEEIATSISAQNNTVEGLSEQVTQNTNAVKDIESAITEYNAQNEQAHSAIQTSISEVGNQLGNLQTNIEGNAASIKNLSNTVENLSSAVQTISNDYLTSANKEELENQIEAERNRAQTVEGSLSKQYTELDSKISTNENTLKAQQTTISGIQTDLANQNSEISEIKENNTQLSSRVSANTSNIEVLREQINALELNGSSVLIPDGKTIGLTDDELKQLYVKISNKEGNLLESNSSENGETGLFVSLPIFCEDDEV